MVSAGAAIAIALYAMALVSILREPGAGPVATLAWSLIAFILPIIGPILWSAVGKRYPYGPSGGNQ